MTLARPQLPKRFLTALRISDFGLLCDWTKCPNMPSLPSDHFKTEGDLNLSPNRSKWSEANISAETRLILDEDARWFLHQSLSTPCLNVLKSAQGAWIEDNEGRRYLDFHGNNVHQVGFGHPRVIAAIKKQLDQLSFCTRRYTCEPAVRLAARLAEVAPGDLSRVLFAPGGTTAIGMALKLARVATGRFKFISMWDSFHGASLDAISIGGETIFRQGIGPLLPGCEHVPPPDNRHCPFKCGNACNLACADYVEYVLEKEGDVAAVIAETVRATPFIPPPDYWKRIRAACDKHGALLILDEIPMGLAGPGGSLPANTTTSCPTCSCSAKALAAAYFLWQRLSRARGSTSRRTKHWATIRTRRTRWLAPPRWRPWKSSRKKNSSNTLEAWANPRSYISAPWGNVTH